jgi:hypothetical protein
VSQGKRGELQRGDRGEAWATQARLKPRHETQTSDAETDSRKTAETYFSGAIAAGAKSSDAEAKQNM